MNPTNKTLCFDLGNTRLKCAVFEGEVLTHFQVLDSLEATHVQPLLEAHRPHRILLSSVVHHPPAFEELLAQNPGFHRLSAASRLPFSTRMVARPESIGADRLALVAAAVALHPREHTLVIGLGSCITYNYVDCFGEFLGGSISPGVQMRFNAMHEHTALLPLAHPDHNFPLIGYNTLTNLHSGVLLGMAVEIDGISERYRERYPNINVLLTGGDMAFFRPHLKTKIFADPHLIYKGLYAISEINA